MASSFDRITSNQVHTKSMSQPPCDSQKDYKHMTLALGICIMNEKKKNQNEDNTNQSTYKYNYHIQKT